MKYLKISFEKHQIDSLLLQFRCMTNYIKIVHFYMYMLISSGRIKKKQAYGENYFIEKTYVEGTKCTQTIPMCQTTYVTENKEENYLQI